ncbi:MAG TPA: ABC transporter permease [Phycisphaerae bacterium]|nr:ABC transporter permease [Phycisphaerae bacterium]
MTAVHVPSDAAAGPAIRSPLRRAVDRFCASKPAVAGLACILTLAILCYGSLPWTLGRYDFQDLNNVYQAPGLAHWMGTDALGRDLLVRMLLGGAISLVIGLSAAAIALVIGLTVGITAGYAGGRIDALLMRTVDVLYGLPYLLLVILLRVALVDRMAGVLGRVGAPQPETLANLLVLLVGIGAVSWLTMARVIRSQVMSLRDQPFVEAARAMGARPLRIMFRHIMPNLVGTILVYATLSIPNAILAESTLSFLGLGVQPPLPTWGSLASDGIAVINPIYIYWWLITWPCVILTLALVCLNFVGDGLRDAVDPNRS